MPAARECLIDFFWATRRRRILKNGSVSILDASNPIKTKGGLKVTFSTVAFSLWATLGHSPYWKACSESPLDLYS